MSKYDCIAVCVLTVTVPLLLGLLSITVPLRDSLESLSEMLSQPGIPTRVEIARMTITNEDGVSAEIIGFNSTVDSRLIDIILGVTFLDSIR